MLRIAKILPRSIADAGAQATRPGQGAALLSH